MFNLPTLLQAMLLVAAAASGVNGIGLQDPSASSDLQQGQHDDSRAIEDPVSFGDDFQDDLTSAGRDLQGIRRPWYHPRPQSTSYAHSDAKAGGGASGHGWHANVVDTKSGTISYAGHKKAATAGYSSLHASGNYIAGGGSRSSSGACVGKCH